MANTTECFFFNYKSFLLDEIALDGLQGIGIELLWKRMENRTGAPLTIKIKEKMWKFIASCKSVSIYHVTESPQLIDIIDRFMVVDESTGYILDPSTPLDGPYEWCPIENIYGSCSNYDTRTLVPKDNIQLLTYDAVTLQYGDKLVLVANIEERWHALAPHLPITYLYQLTQLNYGLLELIGKGRENGQMTVGTTNLSKIVKEPKLLFYNRNVLHKLGLIDVHHTTQFVAGKAMKSILLRLKRFHKPILGSLPKVGMIANIVQYLLQQPDYSELTEVMIKKGYMTGQHCKRFRKTMYIFSFGEKEVKVDRKNSKGEKQKEIVSKKFITLAQNLDDPQSDEECEKAPLQCQYKVGIGIMRQAYEILLDAGLKGLTQSEIAQLLGVEFYTSRSICKVFKSKNLVREFLEDKGRQRTARYIAVAATKDIDKEYDKEKSILLQHVQGTKETIHSANNDDSDPDNDIPIKKLKLNQDKDSEKENSENEESFITELKALEGSESVKVSLLNAKKNLTLRQLKYANGILKVVKDLKYVIGFQALGMLVSKAIKERPMDTKSLKLFVHKLMNDGQLKVLKITRPKKIYYFICAPDIKPSDDIIKNKFKELCSKPDTDRNIKSLKTEPMGPKWQFIYKRYNKIQKLHECVIKFVYFNEDKTAFMSPLGFTSMLTLLPEMNVEFALSYINNLATSDVAKLKIEDKFKSLKIRDLPEKLSNFLQQSKSLQNSVKIMLKILAALGLVQLVHQSATSMQNANNTYVIYVNRHAKLLNTSGKWPRQVDKSELEKSYYFETLQDVKRYWLDVAHICSKTITYVPKRESIKLVYPLRSETVVEMYDKGTRLGNGLGPCGFDSSIFMDIPRLTKPTFNVPPPKVKVKKIVKKKSRPKKVVKEDNLPTLVKRRRPADSCTPTWSSFEDKILMLCKAAITILSPSSQPGALRLRNVVARDLLSLFDPKKIAVYCHKRSMMLESNSVMSYERDCIVNELRRRRDLVKKYDGLLKVLRLRHVGSINRCVQEARLPLLELIWLASQIERTKPYIQRIPCIALNFDDFNKKYTISPTTSNVPFNVYKTPTDEPEFATLKEGIVISVMLPNQLSKETARKLYSIFQVYPEPILRCAVEQLRKSGAIAAREKIMNNKTEKVHFDEIVDSAYKLSANYRRRWITRFESEFLLSIAENLNTPIPERDLRGCSELNCLLCEMTASDVLEIKSDTIPVVTGSAGSIIQEEQMNVIDIETKYKLKSGTIGWKGKTDMEIFSECFEGIDYRSILDSISKDSIVTSCGADVACDVQDPITVYLEAKREKGATFHDLKEHLSMDRNTLCTRLKDLEEKKIVKRVGYWDNRIVLTKHANPWLLQIEPNFYIIPTPWLTLEGHIQIEVFTKWANVIVCKIFESPGCSIGFLSNNFECITARSVQYICEFLRDCECITVRCIKKKTVDLFSDDDDDTDMTDYNPYDSTDNILLFPTKTLFTRYAYVWKKVLDETDTELVHNKFVDSH